MTFREVTVVQVKEVLRRWLRGQGERTAARAAGVDRKTARRYIAAGIEVGLERNGDESQLSDEVVGQVCQAVRPCRPDGHHGAAWTALVGEEDRIKGWVADGLTVTKVHVLLGRRGVEVPYRTLSRFAVERCGAGRAKLTVRVVDPPPGQELQVDFGRMGLVPAGEHKKVCYALIFTACWSRHCYVHLCFSQTTEGTIAGFEEAWEYFGAVFPVVIPDNMSSVVARADAVNPQFNDVFFEYAQSRGFEIDACRVRHPKDKPKVERTVPYVRNNFFAGEVFADLADAQRRAVAWCSGTAGMRVHGTTLWRPLEAYRAIEAPLLLPLPVAAFDVPIWASPKVHRDFHCEVARSLYSVPYTLVGRRLRARADTKTVRFYSAGQLVKLHPRVAPGARSTDPADFPPGKDIYAMRDVDQLRRKAAEAGEAIGELAASLLSHRLPWTKMRQVYRLLGLVAKWGPVRVEAACARALEIGVIDVGLVGRIIENAKEKASTDKKSPSNVVAGRFARDPDEFSPKKVAAK
ncbi:MAG TPA: IS21 family transposase [Chloroflexi bacterium]|jgi:transposase|nr:IS21 family transposase [Chloroflexota bacterium]